MPANYGVQSINKTGYAVRVSADGHPSWKIGGITLDANVLPTNGTGSDLILTLDQTAVKNGNAYLLLGTVMCRITTGEIDVFTNNGSPTGGTFTISVAAGGTTQTTTALAFNAAAATTVQTAIQALSNVGAGNATVTGSAGGPYTITYASSLGTVVTTGSGASLTGGTAPLAPTITSNLAGGQTGAFGPYLSSATDGRQSLNRGDCYILDETWLDYPAPAFGQSGTAHPAVFDGGAIDINKIVLSGGQGTNSLPAGYPAGPSLSAFLTAFPAIRPVND